MGLSLLVDRVSSEVVTSNDVSSSLELIEVLVAAELGEESCTCSSGMDLDVLPSWW